MTDSVFANFAFKHMSILQDKEDENMPRTYQCHDQVAKRAE